MKNVTENHLPCDFVDATTIPGEEMDKDDWAALIDTCYYTIGQVIEAEPDLPDELIERLIETWAQLDRVLDTTRLQ